MKNSSLPRILVALLLALTAATTATAYDFEVDGIYYYYINDDGTSVSVTSGSNKYTGSVTIPSQVTYSGTTYSVTAIGYRAFYGCSGLTSVSIPNSVTSIGYQAFYGCSGLTSVSIPNSVTSIGNFAFDYCIGLKSVTIPNSVTSIGSYAFSGCSGLTSVTIPNSVTSIDYQAFSGCSSLTSVTIPNSVTSIDYQAFYGCSGLVKSAYPSNLSNPFRYGVAIAYPSNGVIEDDGTIYNADKSKLYFVPLDVTSVTIPNSITFIHGDALTGCTRLSTIEYDSNDYCDFSNILNGLENKIRFIYGNSVTKANTQFLHDLQPVSVTIGTNVSSVVGSSYTPTKTIWLTNTPPEGCELIKGTVNFVSNDKYPKEWNITEYSYLSSWFEVDGVVYVPVVPSERTCDAIDVCRGTLPSEITLDKATFNGITMTVKNIAQHTFNGCENLTKLTLATM